MKRIVTIAVAGLAAVLFHFGETSAQKQKKITSGWASVKSDDGRFQIKLPGMTKRQNQTIPTAVGPVKMTMWIYEKSDADNEQAILVSYNDYPEEFTEQADPKDVLKGAQQGALGSLQNSKITEQKEIEFQGRPGREFKFTGRQDGEDGYAAWLIVMDENRLYQVGIIDLMRPIDDKMRKAVIESFKLNKKPE